MIWFLTALFVLALGGVAMLVVRSPTLITPAWDDRPDARLSPEDIDNARFSMALWGYRQREVDQLLQRVSAERAAMERALRRNQTHPDQVRAGGPDGPNETPTPYSG